MQLLLLPLRSFFRLDYGPKQQPFGRPLLLLLLLLSKAPA